MEIRSDHCPAMKGIETFTINPYVNRLLSRSDHCPAMKGIETHKTVHPSQQLTDEATTAPQ